LYCIAVLVQNRPLNRVNTTDRLNALRSAMKRENFQAYLISNNDEHGVSDVTTYLATFKASKQQNLIQSESLQCSRPCGAISTVDSLHFISINVRLTLKNNQNHITATYELTLQTVQY